MQHLEVLGWLQPTMHFAGILEYICEIMFHRRLALCSRMFPWRTEVCSNMTNRPLASCALCSPSVLFNSQPLWLLLLLFHLKAIIPLRIFYRFFFGYVYDEFTQIIFLNVSSLPSSSWSSSSPSFRSSLSVALRCFGFNRGLLSNRESCG